MRFALYATSSSVVTSLVVLYAYATRVQFYPTVIYLVTSKFCILVLGNMALVLTLLFGKMTNRVFLGRLRDSELELVWENSGYAITETCLALTIFRDEMSLNVVILFTALLFCKIFHWLCDARVEHIEQSQETSRLSHCRIVALMLLLFLVDMFFTLISVHVVTRDGASVQLLFGFEYMLLCILVTTTFVRYCLSVVDNVFVQGRWYNKSLYELYLRLLMDILKLVVYFLFFAIVFTYYGVPIHLLRQLYLSFRTVNERLKHFLLFRRVTANLHERFANATEEELAATDRICIICREEMIAGTELGAPKRLVPCGHIFHFYCLRNWFERQLKCPTCRANILPSSQHDHAANPAAVRRNLNRQPNNNANNNDNNNVNANNNIENEDNAAERNPFVAEPMDNEDYTRARTDATQEARDGGGLPAPQPSPAVNDYQRIRQLRLAALRRAKESVSTAPSEGSGGGSSGGDDTSPDAGSSGQATVQSAQGQQQAQGEQQQQEPRPQLLPGLNPAALGIPAMPFNINVNAAAAANTAAATRTDGRAQAHGDGGSFGASASPRVSIGSASVNLNVPVQPVQPLASVTQYIQSQIELLQLQLQVYSAQISAANATREAALATLRVRGLMQADEEARQEQAEAPSDEGASNESSAVDGLRRRRPESQSNGDAKE